MTTTVDIAIEPLTHESFAPFGQIIGELPGSPAWRRPRLTSWRMNFECDGTVDLKLIRYSHQTMELTQMERHLNHTESRIPLMGGRFVMVVAAPTGSPETITWPESGDVRAFLIDGSVGILIWKGTWHSLDTYPAAFPHTDVAFLSEKATQAEIEVVDADSKAAQLTHVIDFSERDLIFQVSDPRGLLTV